MNNDVLDKTAYRISETEVCFLEITAVKKEDLWEYSKTGSWFKKQAMGLLHERFSTKVESLKESKRLAEVHSILCNSAYATELYIHGIITQKMIDSIEEKVAGAGGAMTPMVCIPQQDFDLGGIPLKGVRVVIVGCHSYNGFCFIDKEDKDM